MRGSVVAGGKTIYLVSGELRIEGKVELRFNYKRRWEKRLLSDETGSKE